MISMHEMVKIDNTEERLKKNLKKVGDHLYVHRATKMDVEKVKMDLDNYQVVFLMGGVGTRLLHITQGKISKHMIQVGSQPISKYAYDMWRKAGFKNFCFLIDNTERSKGITDFYGDGKKFNASHIYSTEKQKLGSGGAIKFAIDSNVITTHFFNFHPDDMIVNYPNFPIDFFKICKAAEKEYDIVILCAPGTLYPFGEIVDKDGKVIDFIEKPFIWKDSNTGIYFVVKRTFPFLQKLEANTEVKIERSVFPQVAKSGRMLKVLIPSEMWIPINDENTLRKFESIVTRNK